MKNSTAHSVCVVLNNSFRKIFSCCGEKTQSLVFYCGTLPVLYTVDQRCILFYKKLKNHSSVVSVLIRVKLPKLSHRDISSFAAKYGIKRLDSFVTRIKTSVWKTFAASIIGFIFVLRF